MGQVYYTQDFTRENSGRKTMQFIMLTKDKDENQANDVHINCGSHYHPHFEMLIYNKDKQKENRNSRNGGFSEEPVVYQE